MKITINQSEEALDPGGTVENTSACLVAYFDLCTKALLAEWPQAEIVCNPAGGLTRLVCHEWHAYDYFKAGEICSEIYQAGLFWS
jgi:hypothetical protein